MPTSSDRNVSKVNSTADGPVGDGVLAPRIASRATQRVAAEDMDGSTAGTGADAASVTRLGTASQAEAEQAAPEAEPAADNGDDDLQPDSMAARANVDQAAHYLTMLQGELLGEFSRVEADFDDVKAACQTLAGVDTIYKLTAEQLQKALDDIRERNPVSEPAA